MASPRSSPARVQVQVFGPQQNWALVAIAQACKEAEVLSGERLQALKVRQRDLLSKGSSAVCVPELRWAGVVEVVAKRPSAAAPRRQAWGHRAARLLQEFEARQYPLELVAAQRSTSLRPADLARVR